MTRNEIIQQSQTDEEFGGMYMVIPSVVMLDTALSLSAKILYGVITWKCNRNAYCWQTNRALGEILGLSPKRISTLLSDLESNGHIETEILRNEETGQVLQRNIYPMVKSTRGILDPIPKNKDTPPPDCKDTSPRKCGDPPPKNEEKKDKEESKKNTPYNPPKRGKGDKAGQERVFEAFWQRYPRKVNKARARAVWDKLAPDPALCRVMAEALRRFLASPEWQWDGGAYIPHPATWLRNRRWEDDDLWNGGPDLPHEEPEPPRYGWD